MAATPSPMIMAHPPSAPLSFRREAEGAEMQKWRVGKVTVTKIVELEVTGGSRFILPQATYEEILPIGWLQPHFADERGRLKMSIHALAIETPERRIVVDTCLGNDKEGRRIPTWNNLQGPFLADLAAAGYPRESIDTVLCTHLHVDHVGWNTMLADGTNGTKTWVPTFPNARYLMGRVEFAHWQGQRERDDMAAVFADSVKPVHEAGLVDLVETDHLVCDEISLVPSIGHTPGHVSVRISSEGEEALITGDFMHHPCQIARPHWSSTADNDPDQARQTRERMLKELSEKPVLVIGTHFAGATAGRIVRDGDAYRLAV
jgi:glyoxylase-like metal-dependent hydrolase (beta-lactamase superfamily II)